MAAISRPLIIVSAGAIVASLLTFCPSTSLVHSHGPPLSSSKKARLENKAASGDANAAMELYNYYAYRVHDQTAADPWLRRAAKLGSPNARNKLAELIKRYGFPPGDFGADAPAAVLALLEASSKTNDSSCYALASAYAEGYFGTPDPGKARAYFLQGARLNSRMCWEKLSEYCRHGLGGPRDDGEAYYWNSLEARCIDPRFFAGKERWATREEIASHLSLPELESQWKRIDSFMSQVNAGRITVLGPDTSAESRRLAKKRDDEHRNTLRARKTLPSPAP